LLSVSVVAAAILSGAAAQGVDGLPKCAVSDHFSCPGADEDSVPILMGSAILCHWCDS